MQRSHLSRSAPNALKGAPIPKRIPLAGPPEPGGPAVPERFVDAITAAQFLSIKPRYLLQLARRGNIPAHPLGEGPRKMWRFRLSELSATLTQKPLLPSSGRRYTEY